MIGRYARLLLVFAKVETQYELEYRTNLIFSVLQQAMIMVTSIGAMLILFSYTTTLNGWSLAEMLVLLGVFYIVQGIGDTLFGPSFERLLEHIRLGTLDFTLLKPANGQFLVSTRHVKLRNSAQLVLGLVVLGIGISRLESALSAAQVAGFIVALGCGFALMYSLLLVLSTLAFWFVRVENLLVIYGAFVDASRFPVDIYPGWLRVTLSSVAPVGIAVTVPAQALAGRVDALGIAALALAATLAWVLSAWFWRRGLRSYTGASA
ncbi:MAG TPA: ABC-2 family transporter protein [Candidatus Limnocylindria bacterium]|nr:ABC-2 family transporter protein [Candidatus Limnocylindria bacterium]